MGLHPLIIVDVKSIYLYIYYLYIFRFQLPKPLTCQTMTFVRSNNISLKYQRLAKLGSKVIGMRKSEFVAKTQFLCAFLGHFGEFHLQRGRMILFTRKLLFYGFFQFVLTNISQFLQISLISCKYLSVLGNISQFLQISLSSCKYLSVLANISQFLCTLLFHWGKVKITQDIEGYIVNSLKIKILFG